MFGLFSKKKKTVPFDFSALSVDMHSHLLPGIDDGARNIESSIELIRGMHSLGFRKLITTPHIMWDMYRNTPAIIQQRLDLVRNALAEEGIEVEIHAAAEYFLDEHVEELLKQKLPLLPVSGNKVLVEFSMAFPSMNIKDLLFEMQMQGYQPIIAHPERYSYLQSNKAFYDDLKEIGCLFQLNLLSVTGHYGRTVQDLAQYLISEDMYDLLGTDLHHEGHLHGLTTLQVPAVVMEKLQSGRFANTSL